MKKENALLKNLKSEKENLTIYDIVKIADSTYITPLGIFEVFTERQAQKKLAEALKNDFKKFGSEMFAFTDDCDKLWKEICENYLTDKAKKTLRGYIEDDILSQIETSYYGLETITEYFDISEEEYNSNSESYDEKYVAEQTDYYIQTEGYFEYFNNRDNDGSVYLYDEKVDFDFDGVAEMINSRYGRGIYLSEFNHKETKKDSYYIYQKSDKNIELLSDLADRISKELADDFYLIISAEEIIDFVEMGTVSRKELEEDGAYSVYYA